ncbi:MAG: bifunctional UDP-N-acetylglucosamine diphosphorylase/glucosamine-1-phosphate N-acetyltransferase GlmU [Selenomonadaceae bacterium]|nr:bifunctional UDP-N-acetylglucosamine diphosphorylase/glucosamine-1-phosphate N-acetyltransferase GlmU [Selenomonadaceae bacterium]
MHLETIILAAGKGTRMKSKMPKVLHKVGGKPMLQHVIDAAKKAGSSREVVVIGSGAELVTEVISGVEFVVQEEQLGTGHAVLSAKKNFEQAEGTVLILCGDTPLLTAKLLQDFTAAHENSTCAATVLTAKMPDATGYGRIIREEDGSFGKIVEEKDATEFEKKILEVNAGVYCFDVKKLFGSLEKVNNNNAQGEYYLPDVLTILKNAGEKIGAFTAQYADETLGINSRVQLAAADKIFRMKKNRELMDSGVTIIDPNTTFIDYDAQIGQDTIIHPNTYIEGKTTIGEDCAIGPNIRFVDMKVGNKVTAQFSYCHEAEICDGVTLGPYVHIRPGTTIGENVKIGNFVEIKNSNVGKDSKLPHLQYIGDTDMGSGVNIGCGTVTCNYDGKNKFRTKIGDNVFIGCNTNLVAPVKVGDGAYIAAGSTITKDVPKNNLAVARSRQTNIEVWNDRRK